MAQQHFQTVNQVEPTNMLNCLSSNTIAPQTISPNCELGTVNEEQQDEDLKNGEYDALFITDLLEHMQRNGIPPERVREEAEKMLAA